MTPRYSSSRGISALRRAAGRGEPPALSKKEFGLLSGTTWIVAAERLKTPPNELESPLPQSQLDLAAELLSGSA
jgi:hypothetical protein